MQKLDNSFLYDPTISILFLNPSSDNVKNYLTIASLNQLNDSSSERETEDTHLTTMRLVGSHIARQTANLKN